MSRGMGFQALLESFFLSWLIAGRDVSRRTVESYRDTFVILLRWFDKERSLRPDSLTMDDLTMDNIEAFLIHLDKCRANAPKTVNCRLAAIRSFCRYVSYKDPLRLEEMRKILSIPQRRESRPELSYLEAEEIGWLIDACDKTKAQGRETRLLIKLLYNSGARISEIITLKASDVVFEDRGSCKISIIGKGRKERTLPLWSETSRAIKTHLEEHGIAGNNHLFSGRNVEHLTRSGARSRIKEALRQASAKHPSLARKNITPHSFRHSTAMAMLAAGIDIATIAIWLGHEGIQTTHRYMIANMKLKEEAIQKVHPGWGEMTKGRYKADPQTIAFLMSL